MKICNSTNLYFLLILLLSPVLFGQTLDLSGEWITPCDRGLRKTQVIDGDVATTTEFFHHDRFCNVESFRFKTAGTIKTFPNQPAWIDFAYSEIEITVFVKEVVEDFNARKVCGFTNWSVAMPQQITGLNCALFNMNKETKIPSAGDMKFGIYKIETDHLYYGQMTKEKDSSSPEKRPSEFSPDAFEKKVPGTF